MKADKINPQKVGCNIIISAKMILRGDELPKLRDLIFNSWMPGSEYNQKYDYELEVYHLWTNGAERRQKRYYEIWLPLEDKISVSSVK